MLTRTPVMIIDDSLTTRKILEVCLRREGIASLSFADGLTALTALRESPELAPAVILLDVRLPQQDGFQVALRLRWLLALHQMQTTIILLSGYDGLFTRVKARLVADDYIAKPFTTKAVVSLVSRYVPVNDDSFDPTYLD
ncbi:MAG: response regulator [Ktedonobacteraceae bacterium]